MIAKLHIGDRIVALDRQRHFLKAEPFEHVENGERVCEHRQREVVALQAEGRKADQQTGEAAEHGCNRDHDPWRQIEIDLAERDGIGADPEESRVTERDQSGVSTEQVP